jgi:hypothetical protein
MAMAKSVANKVVKWLQSREEYAGFAVERNVEVRGRSKDIRYIVDIVLRRKSKLSIIFRKGPLSGSAVAVKIKGGKGPVTVQEIRAVQAMAADVTQAVISGKEGCPIQQWLFISADPYEDAAIDAVGLSRILWCGRLDTSGEVRSVL